jgi:hypothetical protein
MALWGNTDNANSVPKFLSDDANAVWPNDKDQAVFIDTTEATVTANRAKGLKTGGWNVYNTYTTEDGVVRHQVESLVPMSETAVAAGDLGVTGNTAVEDTVAADSN